MHIPKISEASRDSGIVHTEGRNKNAHHKAFKVTIVTTLIRRTDSLVSGRRM